MGWRNGGMWNRGMETGWGGYDGAQMDEGFLSFDGTHQMSWNQLELPREGDQPFSGGGEGLREISTAQQLFHHRHHHHQPSAIPPHPTDASGAPFGIF
jgi:hypothetical protein